AGTVQENVRQIHVLSARDPDRGRFARGGADLDATGRDPDIAHTVPGIAGRAIDVDADGPRVCAQLLLDLDVFDSHPCCTAVRRRRDDADRRADACCDGLVAALLAEDEVPDAVAGPWIARSAAIELKE